MGDATSKPVSSAAPMQPARLHIIPIVHGEADLGSLAPAVRRAATAHVGSDEAARAVWQMRQSAIAQHWRRVADWCDALGPDLSSVNVYQDGLPVCGRERAIVDELARNKSPNHLLLVTLIARGATLMGTESGPLLIEELALARKRLAGDASAHDQTKAAQLLRQRDEFIARRIDQTLEPGRRGLLFLGALHDVVGLLPARIDVHTVALAP